MEEIPSTNVPAECVSEDWLAKFRAQFNETNQSRDETETENDTGLIQTLKDLDSRLEEDIERRTEFRISGGLQLLIQMLKTQRIGVEAQETALNILADMAEHDDDCQTIFGEEGGIEAIIASLKQYSDALAVQKAAISGLRALTLTEQNRKLLLENGALQLIISSMDNHSSDALLVEFALSTLACIVFGRPEARKKVGELGGIEITIKCLALHSRVAAVQVQGASALRNLAWECESNQKILLEAGALNVLFEALNNHLDVSGFADNAFGALGNIAVSNTAVSDAILSNSKFFDQVLNALTTYAEDASVCEKVCSLLIHVCESNGFLDSEKMTVVTARCSKADGPVAIVKALEKTTGDFNEGVISKLCTLIQLLSTYPAFRAEFVIAQGISVLLTILRADQIKTGVVTSALSAIGSVLAGDDENKKRFSDIDGVASIVKVMRLNGHSEIVQECCCKVLDNAIDGQAMTTEVLLRSKELALAAVKSAMADYPNCAGLQENACSMLVKIAILSPSDSARLVRLGLRNSVEMVRSTHVGHAGIESLTNQLLSLLVDAETPRSGRGSAATPSGSASARLRSRSRTVGQRGRSQSRAGRSSSPERMLNAGRRAMLVAQSRNATGQSPAGRTRGMTSSNSAQKKVSRGVLSDSKLSLEPVYE